jgi:flagellar hook-associated protein 2
MAGVQLSGLASGFDWQSMIEQLMAVEQTSVTRVQSEKVKLQRRQSALDSVKNNMDSLKSATDDLRKSSSEYYNRTTSLAKDTSTTNSNLSASAEGTTPTGTYRFEVIQKATASTFTGGKAGIPITSTSGTLASLKISTAITAGVFTVNGKEVEVATTDTLADVFTKISTATSGEVTAALASDRIVLTGHDLGSGQPRIRLGASSDTSNFLEAMRLFSDTSTTPATTVSSTQDLGATNVNSVLSSAIDVGALSGITDNAGSFKINGKTINFNTSTGSLRAIMSEVNTSGAGVIMNYDPGADRFTITNTSTGSLDIALEDSTGILAQMGLTTGTGATKTFGVNAQFKVNGGSTVITSNSNTLIEGSHGIPGLSVTIKDTGTDTLTVAAETGTAQKKIQTFVSAYNALTSKIDELTKITVGSNNTVTSAILANNREVSDWQQSIRRMAFGSELSSASGIARLDDLGIDFDSDGKLSIEDSTVLTEALTDDPEGVAKFFNDSSTGIATKIYSYINTTIGADGSYDSQTESISSQLSKLDTQIDTLTTQLANKRERLTASFVAMETAQAQIQQNGKTLNNFLSGL